MSQYDKQFESPPFSIRANASPSVGEQRPDSARVVQVLRDQAEMLLQKRTVRMPTDLESMTPHALRQLLHELQLHQIELEMQNEELRRTHLELDLSQARYFDFYDLAPVGYCTLSEKGMILEANLTTAALLGVDRRVLIQRPMTRFIRPEDQDLYYLCHRKLMATGEPQRFDLRMTREGAAEIWVQVHAVRVHGADGERECRAVLSDITDRKRTEIQREQLLVEAREANLRLTTDMEAMQWLQDLGRLYLQNDNLENILTKVVDAAIAIAKADFGNIQMYSPATAAFKIAAQRGFPQWWIDFWDHAAKGQGVCGAALELGDRVVIDDVEQSPVFADAAARDVQRRAGVRAMHASPLHARSGRLIGIFSIYYKRPHHPDEHTLQLIELLGHHAADIIEKAQSDTDLLQTNLERLELALEAAKAGIWTWDLRTNEIHWSDELWKVSGLTPQSAPPTYETWRQTIHPADRANAEQAMQAATRNGTELNAEWRVCDSNGAECWLLSRGKATRDASGEVARYNGIVIDITERKRIEGEMQVSKAKLEAAMASMTDAVFISDADGRLIDCNDAFVAFYKFKDKSECPQTYAEYSAFLEVFTVDGDPVPLERWTIPRALQGETVTNLEVSLRRKDTGETWMGSYSFAPIRNQDGTIVGSVVVGRDITSNKEEELTKIRRLKDRYRAIVMDQNDLICRFDPQGRITFVNDAYCRCFGVNHQEILGANFLPPIHPDDLPLVQDHFKSLTRVDPQRTIEHRVYLADGKVHWQQWSGRALFDDKGELHEYQAVGRDITKLEETKEKLQNELRLRQLFLDALPCSALLVQHHTYRIVAANKAAVAAGAAPGKQCYKTWMKQENPCPWCLAPMALKTGENQNDQFWDGEVFRDVYWMPIDEELYLHYSFDVTEEQKIKEALEKAHAEMEQRIKERTLELQQSHEQLIHAEKLTAIGNLSASIAHEFNNPLQSVMTILRGVGKYATLDEKETELVELALMECVRMKNLIADLRDFHRPSSGKPELVDVHAALDALLVFCKKDFRNREITAVKNYADNVRPVMAVNDQLKQVFLNLLNNAADACEGGGRITVATDTIGTYVVVHVEDNGVGISAENLGRIFEPFFTTKPELKGTGLGLSVSYGIIKKHGGRIDVFSKPGQGARFSVFLPMANNDDER
jgi:PAS domain S-box-containing protein